MDKSMDKMSKTVSTASTISPDRAGSIVRILWISRHPPLAAQLATLRQLYGPDASVIQDPRPFDSAEDICERFQGGGYQDCVVVAPLSVLQRLVDLGLRPLWAEMQRVDALRDPTRETLVGNRVYRFTHFRRVRAVRLELDEARPFEAAVAVEAKASMAVEAKASMATGASRGSGGPNGPGA